MRKTITKNKKIEIVNFYLEHGMKNATKKFDVHPVSIYNWRKQLRNNTMKETSYSKFLNVNDMTISELLEKIEKFDDLKKQIASLITENLQK